MEQKVTDVEIREALWQAMRTDEQRTRAPTNQNVVQTISLIREKVFELYGPQDCGFREFLLELAVWNHFSPKRRFPGSPPGSITYPDSELREGALTLAEIADLQRARLSMSQGVEMPEVEVPTSIPQQSISISPARISLPLLRSPTNLSASSPFPPAPSRASADSRTPSSPNRRWVPPHLRSLREGSATDNNSNHSSQHPSRVVLLQYPRGDWGDNDVLNWHTNTDHCDVCHRQVCREDCATMTPCGHICHYVCADRWREGCRTDTDDTAPRPFNCPICRSALSGMRKHYAQQADANNLRHYNGVPVWSYRFEALPGPLDVDDPDADDLRICLARSPDDIAARILHNHAYGDGTMALNVFSPLPSETRSP